MKKKNMMDLFHLAIGLLVLALIVGVLGFGGLAADFAVTARTLLFIFIVLFIVSPLAQEIL